MKKTYLILLAILLVFFISSYLLKVAFAMHIKVKFQDLRPFNHNVPVYFKGIKVGKVLSRNHSDDYNHTLLTILIFPNDLKLPKGTVAYLKCHKLYNHFKRDYIDIVFPNEPVESYLPNNSTIEGRATIDISEFGANQNIDEINKIKDDLAQSAENLNYAIGGLSDLFATLNDILIQNRNNLYKSSTNVSNATGNLSSFTKKIDNSINQEKLNATFDSVALVSENLNSTTTSLDSNIDDVTRAINNIQDITCDASAITKGIRKTLSKPFGGFRLFFGRSINEKSCP